MSKQNESKLFAFLGVLLTIIGFVIVLVLKKKDKYAMFYGKQGLILFFLSAIIWVLSFVLKIVPILGQIATVILYVILVVIWLIALINSLSGIEKETLLIGHYAKKINV